jgi:hypothetical protein
MRAALDAFAPLWNGMPASEERDQGDEHRTHRFRAIFISDIHLGTAGFQAMLCWVF